MTQLIQPPYEKYWDEPGQITRREIQRMANKLASNDAELMGMTDMASLIINYICEVHLKVTRADLEIYVEAKKLQLTEAREKMKKQEAEASTQPNPSEVV